MLISPHLIPGFIQPPATKLSTDISSASIDAWLKQKAAKALNLGLTDSINASDRSMVDPVSNRESIEFSISDSETGDTASGRKICQNCEDDVASVYCQGIYCVVVDVADGARHELPLIFFLKMVHRLQMVFL